jgi:hypothetical protein
MLTKPIDTSSTSLEGRGAGQGGDGGTLTDLIPKVGGGGIGLNRGVILRNIKDVLSCLNANMHPAPMALCMCASVRDTYM